MFINNCLARPKIVETVEIVDFKNVKLGFSPPFKNVSFSLCKRIVLQEIDSGESKHVTLLNAVSTA